MRASYHCRTNLDEGRMKRWPEMFVTCPRVGDYVCADDGYRLKVVAITHKIIRPSYGNNDRYPYPCIEVELHR